MKPSALHCATDGALVAEIVRLNNRLEHLLHSPELTGLVLPALRSDYRLIETYGGRKPSYSQVRVPVAALVGREDSELSLTTRKLGSGSLARASSYAVSRVGTST